MQLRRLKRDILYRGRVFDLIVDQVQYPSGKQSVREIAHHPGGAVAVPLFEDACVLFVEQHRYPLDGRLLELPAGKLDRGEEPAIAAARELEEETGWKAAQMEKLVSIYTTPGFCDEELHLFLATGLTESSDGHRREEGEESMTLHRIPLDEAVRMIERGDIKDSKTIIGLLLTHRYLNRTR